MAIKQYLTEGYSASEEKNELKMVDDFISMIKARQKVVSNRNEKLQYKDTHDEHDKHSIEMYSEMYRTIYKLMPELEKLKKVYDKYVRDSAKFRYTD
jgi:hypothetical protein